MALPFATLTLLVSFSECLAVSVDRGVHSAASVSAEVRSDGSLLPARDGPLPPQQRSSLMRRELPLPAEKFIPSTVVDSSSSAAAEKVPFGQDATAATKDELTRPATETADLGIWASSLSLARQALTDNSVAWDMAASAPPWPAPSILVLSGIFLSAAFSQALVGFGPSVLWSSGLLQIFVSAMLGTGASAPTEAAAVAVAGLQWKKALALLAGAEVLLAIALVCCSLHSIDWPQIALAGIPLMFTDLLGRILLPGSNLGLWGQVAGVVILLYSSCSLNKLRSEPPDSMHRQPCASTNQKEDTVATAGGRSYSTACLALKYGSVCGFFFGIRAGVIGPAVALYSSSMLMEKAQVRSNVQAMILVTQGLPRILAVAFNLLHSGREGFQAVWDMDGSGRGMVLLMVPLVSGALGIAGGMALHSFASDGFMNQSVLLLCVLTSCGLLGGGSSELSRVLFFGISSLIVLVTFADLVHARLVAAIIPREPSLSEAVERNLGMKSNRSGGEAS